MSTQIRSTFKHDLQVMQDDVLRMSSWLDAAIQQSLQALADRNANLARQVIADDARINAQRFTIEEACIRLIATQQPAASDLRAIVAAMNIISDLERMADHAAGIARIVLRMGDEALLKPLVDMPRMADLCREMTRVVLDAYVARDANAARRIAARDDEVDNLYNQIFRELLSFMVEDPRTTSRALYLLFAAHNLERIGDRVTNIAERVIFITSGEMHELGAGPQAPI